MQNLMNSDKPTLVCVFYRTESGHNGGTSGIVYKGKVYKIETKESEVSGSIAQYDKITLSPFPKDWKLELSRYSKGAKMDPVEKYLVGALESGSMKIEKNVKIPIQILQ